MQRKKSVTSTIKRPSDANIGGATTTTRPPSSSSTEKPPPGTDSSSDPVATYLGEGWLPVSLSQKHRLLARGPLYDPSTAPKPVAKGGLELSPSRYWLEKDDHEEDEEDDDPISVPLPAGFYYPALDLVDPVAAQQLQETFREKGAEEGLDDPADAAVTHQVLIDMARLGKPNEWSAGEFEESVDFVRNVLERQRILFPTSLDAAADGGTQPPGGGSSKKGSAAAAGGAASSRKSVVGTLSSTKSSGNLMAELSTSNKSEPTEEELEVEELAKIKAAMESIAAEKPRSAVVGYEQPLFYAACGLLSVPNAPKDPHPATAAAAPGSASHTGGPPIGPACWDLPEFERRQEEVLKKIKILQRKQQLFVGFGRRIRFDTVETGWTMNHGLEEEEAEEQKGKQMLSKARAPIAPTAFCVQVVKPEPSASRHGSIIPTSSALSASSERDADPTVDQRNRCRDDDDGNDIITSAERRGSSPSSPERVVVSPSTVWCEVPSCGDPSSVEALDRCEWEAEGPPPDDFDLVETNVERPLSEAAIQLQRLLDLRAAKKLALAQQVFAPVTEVESFCLSKAPSKPIVGSNRKPSVGSAATPPAPLFATTSHTTFSPPTSSPSPIAGTGQQRTTAPEGAADGSPHSAGSRRPPMHPDKGGSRPPSSMNQPHSNSDLNNSSSRAARGTSATSSVVAAEAARRTSSAASSANGAVAAPLAQHQEGPGSHPAVAPPPSSQLADLLAVRPEPPVDEAYDALAGMPKLTVVFPPFRVVSTTKGTDGKPVHVIFQQARPFFLRPPTEPTTDHGEDDEEEEEDEYFDDAVEAVQRDMDDHGLVPLTPPGTPVGFQFPALEEEPLYRVAPFTQMMIDRLEAGMEPNRSATPSEDEEEVAAQDAQEEVRQQMAQAEAAAAVEREQAALREKEEAIRVAKLEAIREQLQGALQGQAGSADAAAQRTFERFTAPSKRNERKPGSARLVRSLPPLREEGTASVVKRLMRRAGKDVAALSKAAEQAKQVSFRPSRRFLAQVLRFTNFGSLIVALLSDPDEPMPEGPLVVDVGQLGASLLTLIDGSPHHHHDDSRAACPSVDWATLCESLRIQQQECRLALERSRDVAADRVALWLRRAEAYATLTDATPTAAQQASRRGSTSIASSSKALQRPPRVEERVILNDAPFFPHFLPRSSKEPKTAASLLATWRREPRSYEDRGGLSEGFVLPAATQRKLLNAVNGSRVSRMSGGAQSGKREFSSKQRSTLQRVTTPLQDQPRLGSALATNGMNGSSTIIHDSVTLAGTGRPPSSSVPRLAPLLHSRPPSSGPVGPASAALPTSAVGGSKPGSRSGRNLPAEEVFQFQRAELARLEELRFEQLHPVDADVF